MLTLHLPGDLCSPVLLFLANLAIVALATAAATLLVCNLVCRRRLPLRHLMLLGGLVALLASPMLIAAIEWNGFSLIGVVRDSRADSRSDLERSMANDSAALEHARQIVRGHQTDPRDARSAMSISNRRAARTQSAASAKPRAGLVASHRSTAIETPAARSPRWSIVSWITFVLAAIWLAGACWHFYWMQTGLRGVNRLRRSVGPIEDPKISRFAHAAAKAVGLRECPPVGQSAATNLPLAVGILHGQVILPCDRFDAWSEQQWMSLLVHEMAHIRRRDLLVGFLQRLGVAIHWWNPLVRRLSSEISCVREQICDDLVVERAGGATGYANLLVEFAFRVAEGHAAAAALGVADGSASELKNRVRRLMDSQRSIVTSLSRWMTSVGLAFCVAIILSPLAIAIHASSAAARDGAKSADEPGKSAAVGKKSPGKVIPSEQSADSQATKQEMLKTAVRVVDTQGRPVAGATIKGWAIRTAPPLGAQGIWAIHGFGQSEPPTVVTDSDGKAIIPFPRYAIAAEKLLTMALSVSVEHPDFAKLSTADVGVGETQRQLLSTIVLRRGAQVVVKAFDGDKALPMDHVQLLCSEASIDMNGAKLSADGWLKSPRLEPPSAILQLVYLPSSGAAMFSEPQYLSLVDGGEKQLRLAMKPAISVDGRLDESVPRPVTNGRVVAQVIQPWVEAGGQALAWYVSTKVNSDGSFQLADLPPGELQVTALCDGFMAASGTPPRFISRPVPRPSGGLPSSVILPTNVETKGLLRPQVFDPTQTHSIAVKMTRTADCSIHVVGPDNHRIAGARCGFNPNVVWWGWGSQIYCKPMYSSIESLRSKAPELTARDDLYLATTNADGIAVVKNLPPGDESLAVFGKNFVLPTDHWGRRNLDVTLVAGQTAHILAKMEPEGSDYEGGDETDDEHGGAPFVNVPGRIGQIPKPTAPQSFKTRPKHTELAGVVVDEQGRPLEGVRVKAWAWCPGSETKTDQQGRFTLGGFDRGEAVEVEFTKGGYSPSLFIAQKAGSANWTIVLTQGTWLEGTVFDPQGRPVPRALVRASRGPFENPQVLIGAVWTETHADAIGKYRLDLEPGEYDVQVRIAGIGAVRHEKTSISFKEKKSLDLRLNPGVDFRATIRDSVTHKPVPGIVLFDWQHREITGTSDIQGVLEIPNMISGEFDFQVSAVGVDPTKGIGIAGDYARWWSEAATNPLERGGNKGRFGFQANFDELTFKLQGDHTDVDIFVEPAATITGRVVDPDGKPVARATVAPSNGHSNSITGDTRFSYQTDSDGHFVVKLPASGALEYNLIAHDGAYDSNGNDHFRRWANVAGSKMRTTPGEKIDGVELKLNRPATIRGQVFGATGEPRAHCDVRALAVDQSDNRYYLPTTTADDKGRYELRFVPPGKQYVQIAPLYLPVGQAPAGTAKIVNVKPGETIENFDFK